MKPTYQFAIGAGLMLTCVASILSACTATSRAHLSAYGSAGRITCYSGGHLFLDDFSTGKIANAASSDGYDYASATTGHLMQANGDCVVDSGAQAPAGWHATIPADAVATTAAKG